MDIKTHQRKRIGYLTLDKPETLNALTESMIDELTEGLQRFEAEDSVEAVVINSSSSRAFCAGGDMKTYSGIVAKQRQEGDRFVLRKRIRLESRNRRMQ